MTNSHTAVFAPGSRSVILNPLWQWDYGQVLKFSGLDLPDAYEVHFSNCPNGESTTALGNVAGVLVPDMYFISGQPIYAWVYLHTGATDGETVYTVTIPINRRARPTADPPSEREQDIFTAGVALLSAKIDDIDNVARYAAEAKEAAQDAEAVQEAIKDILVTPEMFGAVGDGVTDDSTAIQTAINYALTNGYTFNARQTRYAIAGGIDVVTEDEAQKSVFLDFCGAEFVVIADMNYAIRAMTSSAGFGSDAARFARVIQNLTINGNEKATYGIHHVMARNLWYENITINDVKSVGLYADGGVKADKITVNKNLDVLSDYPNTRGIVLNSTDNKLAHIRVRDVNIGIEINGASNFMYDVHCWLISRSVVQNSVCFDVNAGFNFFIGCYADTYETGWDFSDNDNNQSLVGCKYYINPSFYNDSVSTTQPCMFKFKNVTGANDRVNIVGFIHETYPYYNATGRKVRFSNLDAGSLTGDRYMYYDKYNKALDATNIQDVPIVANTKAGMQPASFETTDLDGLKEAGFYGTFRKASVNYPGVGGDFANLINLKDSSNDVTQIAVPMRIDAPINYRLYRNSTSTWSAWRTLQSYKKTTNWTVPTTGGGVTVVSGGYITNGNVVFVNVRFAVESMENSTFFSNMPLPLSPHFVQICSAEYQPNVSLGQIGTTGNASVFELHTLPDGEYVISTCYLVEE